MLGFGQAPNQNEEQEAQRQQQQREQMESDYGSLRQIHGQQNQNNPNRDVLLRNLLDEAHQSRGHTTFSGEPPDWGGGDTGRTAQGGYEIRMARDIEDPDVRKSYLFHELTHVSADRAYTGNPNLGESFLNVHADQDNQVGPVGQQRRQQVQGVLDHLDDDHGLGQQHRQHIKSRLENYAQANPIKEHDTVINELYMYSHLKGIKGTATGQRLRGLAQAGYDRRRDPQHGN